jgi:hypothetical protein
MRAPRCLVSPSVAPLTQPAYALGAMPIEPSGMKPLAGVARQLADVGTIKRESRPRQDRSQSFVLAFRLRRAIAL